MLARAEKPEAPEADEAAEAARPPGQSSYTQILKSTAVIGASSLINVGFSVIRYKLFALMLGPSGIGLFGVYNSIVDLAQGISGVGVQASGVRQIAAANGTGDARRIAVTATVVRRVSLFLAIAGAAALALFAWPISTFTFGDAGQVAAVAMLGLAVFCRVLAGGQMALLQGMQRIASLAWISTLGAGVGTLAAIPLVYFWGSAGMAPSLVVMAAVALVASWWFSRRMQLADAPIGWAELRSESLPLLRLGMVFMVSSVLGLASAYVIRLIVLRADGLVAAGLYQAAWTIGGLYASFILQAMGTDFYPRLTAVCHDDEQCNRLVNEQAQISILLAGPGVLATLTLAPLILSVLYSGEFLSAVDLLRWICLGMMLRVLAWPMGFIIVARGAERAFFWTEIAATAVHVGLAWMLVESLGLAGAGLAFLGLYVWHGSLIYVIVRRMSGFRWSPINFRLIALFLGASVVLLAAFATLPPMAATLLGVVATAVCSLISARMLLKLMPQGWLPARLLRGRRAAAGSAEA